MTRGKRVWSVSEREKMIGGTKGTQKGWGRAGTQVKQTNQKKGDIGRATVRVRAGGVNCFRRRLKRRKKSIRDERGFSGIENCPAPKG